MADEYGAGATDVRAVHEYADFTAIHDHMPGADGHLRVSGTVVTTTRGWKVELRDHEGAPPFNPDFVFLDLALMPPDEPATTPALEKHPVEWRSPEPTEREHTDVQFFVTGTADDPPASLKVMHPV